MEMNVANTPHFYFGVVEDRNDPLEMGRVRVRWFGVHTADKSNIPTADLPWAMPVMPYNSASISGVGWSATGPVEGTWVFGTFMDAAEQQSPIVLGTMVGFPRERLGGDIGFSDPTGHFPRTDYMNQSDIHKLARGEDAYGDEGFSRKIEKRQLDVRTAVPPKVPSVKIPEPPDYYTRHTWNEPNPRYGGEQSDDTVGEFVYALGKKAAYSAYPYNHTWTTESGHAFEMDDTPQAERIHLYHNKGTFFEIQPDGTRVTKIMGKDYEIVAKDKKVLITGNTDVTFGATGKPADVRIYVHKDQDSGKGGDLYLEVDGDFNLNVKGDMVTKIQGNDEKVVMSDQATQINGQRKERITGDKLLKVDGSHNETIAVNHNHTITGNTSVAIGGRPVTPEYDEEGVQIGDGVSGYGRYFYHRTLTVTPLANTNFTTNNFTVGATANINMRTDTNFKIDANDVFDLDARNNIEMKSLSGDFVANSAAGLVDIDGNKIYLDATRIDLNKPQAEFSTTIDKSEPLDWS